MTDDFLLLKLNRTVWVSLLTQGNLAEGISYFESYIANLEMFTKDKKFKAMAEEEISLSKYAFMQKASSLAKHYFEEQDYPNAAICYTSLFKYNQKDIDLIQNYITCLDALEQYTLAAALAKHLENLAPDNVEVYKILAGIYDKKGENYKSTETYEKYLQLKDSPVNAAEYNLLGCYYNKLFSDTSRKQEYLIKSLNNFKTASDMVPFEKLYAKNATIMAEKACDSKTGRFYWNRVFDIGTLNNDDKYDYAAYCLKNEDFEGWHKYFGARFQKENNRTKFPQIDKPEWDGIKDISKSTLLIYYEQGFGDTFLMWGYISRLVPLAKHIIFATQDATFELFRKNPYGIKVIPECNADLKKIKFDYYIPMMSIPAALNLNRENISVGSGYLKASDEIKNKFREKHFNTKNFKIGISFAGSDSGNKTRDIPADKFLPLDKLKNIEIYCLTKDINDSAFSCFKHNKVINIAKEFKDFADTAAVIDCLDLIITSDNCILNLAGALGKKTFALFNRQSDFRWFDLSGEDVVWFTSVKPFVNKTIDGWEETIESAVEAVKKLQLSQ